MGRESMGLQIGLILSAIVNVALGVTAYMFNTNAQEAAKKTEAANKAAQEADKGKKEAEEVTAKVKTVVGGGEADNSEAIQASFDKDWNMWGSKDAAAKREYHSLCLALDQAVKDRDAAVVKAKQAQASSETEKATAVAAAKKDVEDQKKIAADAQADRDKIKADFDQEIGKARSAQGTISKQSEAGLAAYTKKEEALKDQIAKLQSENIKILKDLTQLKNALNAATKDNFDYTQGKVTYVNQLENSVYINLGRDDRLRKGISFGVYPPKVVNVNTAKPKGSIEVIDVSEAHVAQARIVRSELSDPILPGDEIFTLAWSPGQQQHFAITGFIDLDGSGLSGRQKVHDLIMLNGGLVDAEMDEKGVIGGSLTVGTRYLIVGERPNDKSPPPVISGFGKMMSEAERLKIETISVQKFLNLVGYVPRAVSAGGSGVRKPAAKSGDKAADGKDSAFKPRKPSDGN